MTVKRITLETNKKHQVTEVLVTFSGPPERGGQQGDLSPGQGGEVLGPFHGQERREHHAEVGDL